MSDDFVFGLMATRQFLNNLLFATAKAWKKEEGVQ